MDATQARHSAFEVSRTIRAARPEVSPEPSPDGTGLPHALYLALNLAGEGPGIAPRGAWDGASTVRSLAAYGEAARLPSHAGLLERDLSSGMDHAKALRWLGFLQVVSAYEFGEALPPPGEGDPMSEASVMLCLGRIQGILVCEGVTTPGSERGRNAAAVRAMPAP